MAIISGGRLEISSIFPNTDWYEEGNEVIDETTPEGKELLEKLLLYNPFFILIRDDDGKIVNVEDDPIARKAWEEEEQQAKTSRMPTNDERIEALELGLLSIIFNQREE